MLERHLNDFRQWYPQIGLTFMTIVTVLAYRAIKKEFKVNKEILPEYDVNLERENNGQW